ncbi:hypothetical protein FA13DRAFT_1784138 [Coprinellus micaceus]|uniref:F-box domain-containing protein n=1 Tax=Coprinellus micaceus TaxID=71717 RepID=A0A4Y7R4D1_COPMI|nr:hypothetical protein FA13DRAFT_1784138 [Coprinellus micaceus]
MDHKLRFSLYALPRYELRSPARWNEGALDTTLVATDQAIRSHQDFIRLHSALLSPARVVPLDVLAIISRRSTAFKTANPRHPIVSVTHICHEWRELAVRIPSLWRSMDLIIERVTVFLSRAAPLPIVLSCAGADAHSLEDLNFHREVTPLINILRTAQWEDVSLSIDIKTSTSPLVHLLPIPATSVATIRSVKARELKGVWGLQRVFPAGSPPLQNLQVLDLDCSGEQLLNTGPHSFLGSKLIVPSLRRLSAGYFYIFGVPQQASDKAEGLIIQCGDAFALGREVPNHRLFPDRERDDGGAMSRTLGEHDASVYGALIPLTSSARLRIPNTNYRAHSPASLHQEYGSQLTKVTLGCGHLTQSALTSCLEHLKNVTSLTLSPAQTDRDHSVARLVREHRWNPVSSFVDRVLLDRITPKPRSNDSTLTDPCLCPNLESLSYEIVSEDDTLDAWMALIAARCSTLRGERVAYLQKVTLFVPSRFGLDLEAMLSQLEDRGVGVEGVKLRVVKDSKDPRAVDHR